MVCSVSDTTNSSVLPPALTLCYHSKDFPYPVVSFKHTDQQHHSTTTTAGNFPHLILSRPVWHPIGGSRLLQLTEEGAGTGLKSVSLEKSNVCGTIVAVEEFHSRAKYFLLGIAWHLLHSS